MPSDKYIHLEGSIAAGRAAIAANIAKSLTDPNDDQLEIVSNNILAKANTPEQKQKVKKVMDEWKSGTLQSSSGQPVTNQKQAIAIAMSEAGLNKAEIDDVLEKGGVGSGPHKVGDKVKLKYDRGIDSNLKRTEIDGGVVEGVGKTIGVRWSTGAKSYHNSDELLPDTKKSGKLNDDDTDYTKHPDYKKHYDAYLDGDKKPSTKDRNDAHKYAVNNVKKSNDDTLQKGEGSRGGKIIGHTKSGKAIYEGKFYTVTTPGIKGFDSKDQYHDVGEASFDENGKNIRFKGSKDRAMSIHPDYLEKDGYGIREATEKEIKKHHAENKKHEERMKKESDPKTAGKWHKDYEDEDEGYDKYLDAVHEHLKSEAGNDESFNGDIIDNHIDTGYGNKHHPRNVAAKIDAEYNKSKVEKGFDSLLNDAIEKGGAGSGRHPLQGHLPAEAGDVKSYKHHGEYKKGDRAGFHKYTIKDTKGDEYTSGLTPKEHEAVQEHAKKNSKIQKGFEHFGLSGDTLQKGGVGSGKHKVNYQEGDEVKFKQSGTVKSGTYHSPITDGDSPDYHYVKSAGGLLTSVHAKNFVKGEEDELEKSNSGKGEGSRGGKVIGHTKSGKPVYEGNHPSYTKDFTSKDFEDARDLHNKIITSLQKKPASDENIKSIKHHTKQFEYHDNKGIHQERAEQGAKGYEKDTAKIKQKDRSAILEYYHGENPKKFFSVVSKHYTPTDDGESEYKMFENLNKHKNLEKIVSQLHEKFATEGGDEEKINKAFDDLLEKGSGEGSKGGEILGHTKSGKPIYKGDKVHHPMYGHGTVEGHSGDEHNGKKLLKVKKRHKAGEYTHYISGSNNLVHGDEIEKKSDHPVNKIMDHYHKYQKAVTDSGGDNDSEEANKHYGNFESAIDKHFKNHPDADEVKEKAGLIAGGSEGAPSIGESHKQMKKHLMAEHSKMDIKKSFDDLLEKGGAGSGRHKINYQIRDTKTKKTGTEIHEETFDDVSKAKKRHLQLINKPNEFVNVKHNIPYEKLSAEEFNTPKAIKKSNIQKAFDTDDDTIEKGGVVGMKWSKKYEHPEHGGDLYTNHVMHHVNDDAANDEGYENHVRKHIEEGHASKSSPKDVADNINEHHGEI